MVDIVLGQLDYLTEKEKVMRYGRRKGIAEASSDFLLSPSLPEEYKYTSQSDDIDFIPSEQLLDMFQTTMRTEQIRGAMDALRTAGIKAETIKSYLSEHYGISLNYAQNFLDDDSDFFESVGGIV